MAPPKKDDVGGDPGNNGWNAWANHVLLELKRLNGLISCNSLNIMYLDFISPLRGFILLLNITLQRFYSYAAFCIAT